jgi:hypothetical protein
VGVVNLFQPSGPPVPGWVTAASRYFKNFSCFETTVSSTNDEALRVTLLKAKGKPLKFKAGICSNAVPKAAALGSRGFARFKASVSQRAAM